MTKTYRKIFLSIATFLLVLCFGMGLSMGVANTAKASGALTVTKVEQTYLESYNSAAGGYRSEYIVWFNDLGDTLSGHADGADITSVYTTFGSNVTVNGTALSGIQDAYKIFKASANAIKIETGRPMGYAKFAFLTGLTIGDYVLESDVTYYENQDWTYTTTAPEFRFQMGMFRPNVTEYAQFTFSHTGSGAVGNSTLAGLKVNGQMLTESETSVTLSDFGKSVTQVWNGQANWGGDYDNGTSGTGFHFYLKKSYLTEQLAIGDVTFTFPAGFTIGGQSLAQAQTLVLPKGAPIGDNSKSYYCHMYDSSVNVTEKMIASIVQTKADGYGHKSDYEITFSGSADAFVGFSAGDDMTYYFKAIGLYDKVLANGTNLATCDANKKITFTKVSANVVNMTVACCIHYIDLDFSKAMFIPTFGFYNGSQTFYENRDFSFTESKTKPAVQVMSVYPIATGSWATAVNFKIVFNQPLGKNASNNSNIVFEGITIGGNAATNGGASILSVAGETIYGGTQYNITVPNAFVNPADGGKVIFHIPAGIGNTVKTTEAVDFVADHNDYSKWSTLPKFTVFEGFEVNYVQGEYHWDTTAKTLVLATPDELPGYEDGKLFLGWSDGEKLYKAGENYTLTDDVTLTAVEIGAFETTGAAVRVVGSAGLRFETTINTADLEKWSAYIGEYGTMLARTAELTANGETLANAVNSSIVTIASSVVLREDGDNTVFSGGIMDMYEHNFDIEISGCAYITVNYASGSEKVYTDAIVRKASEVAQQTIADGEYDDDAQLEMLNKYLGN